MHTIHGSNIWLNLTWICFYQTRSHESKSEIIVESSCAGGWEFLLSSQDNKALSLVGQFPVMNVVHFYWTLRMTFCR